MDCLIRLRQRVTGAGLLCCQAGEIVKVRVESPTNREDLFRLHHFIAFVRRAIEQALGTINSIPVYSS